MLTTNYWGHKVIKEWKGEVKRLVIPKFVINLLFFKKRSPWTIYQQQNSLGYLSYVQISGDDPKLDGLGRGPKISIFHKLYRRFIFTLKP